MGIKINSKPKEKLKPDLNINMEVKVEEPEDFEEGLDEVLEEETIIKEETITKDIVLKKEDALTPPTVRQVITNGIEDLKNHEVSPANIEDQTDKMIEKIHQNAVLHTVQNNEDVQKKVLQSAEEKVLSGIEIKRNEQMVKVVKATYNANKDACENLGLSEEGRPMWQIRVAKVINDFWFIVWAIISSFTLTPIIFFLKRIGTQVKSAKLTWVLTTIFYLLILFLIFLIIVSIWNNSPNAPEWVKKF